MNRPEAAGGAVRGAPQRRGPPATGVRSTLTFIAVWTGLNITINSRYPAPESGWWTLLPSIDVAVMGLLLGLCAWRRRRWPTAAIAVAAVLLVLVRLFRVADGVGIRYFNRPLNLYLDLRLLPELVRLLGATVARWILVLSALGLLLILMGVGVLGARALRYAEGYLGHPAHRRWAAATVASFVLLSVLLAALCRRDGAVGDMARPTDQRRGAFGASVVPRLWHEAAFALHREEYRRALRARMESNEQRLAALPHDLANLGGADIFLFLIESYGATVTAVPEHLRQITPVYAAFESALRAGGFSVVSGALDSPTYAGRSWLAQATLATGVRTQDAIAFGLLQERRPPALPNFLRAAGYRTIFVQPGTTTRWPERWSYGVDRTYSAWDFDYQGPIFRWASMPDQYVIDFVDRREVARPHGPLFAAYALVSSHAPWSDQPQVVADWNDLERGTIYQRLPMVHFPMSWLNLKQAGTAYVRSIAYDLVVLQKYILEKVPPGALVIVLGDHQPVGDVTGHDPSPAVPVHVISQNRRFTDKFRARGYVPGMRPDTTRPAADMETFLPGFLSAFSTPAAPGPPR